MAAVVQTSNKPLKENEHQYKEIAKMNRFDSQPSIYSYHITSIHLNKSSANQ